MVCYQQPPMEDRPDSPLWQERVLALAIACGAWTALTSELLSIFRALTRLGIAAAWLIAALILILVLRRRHGWAKTPLRDALWGDSLARLCFLIVLTDVAILLLIALLAPPNTNDSLQYHLSRVAHWAQQRSLLYYPTPIDRQLWMPPFAEMAILHLYVLASGDRLVNLVQWGSMVLSLVAIWGIARRLGADERGQAFALLFAATLPMGILQATSTQNDYVTGLWALCLASLAVKAYRIGLRPYEWALAGVATGLGMLTKATFYAFAAPSLIWLGITVLRRRGWLAAARLALTVGALAALLNAGYWSRNLRAYGQPLGPSDVLGAHGNEILGWRTVVSNAVRSLTLHIATPYGEVNGLLLRGVEAIHRWIGLDVNDPRTTMHSYRIKRSFHEDYAGNPFHALLAPLCAALLLWLFLRQRGRDPGSAEGSDLAAALLMAAAVMGSAFLFFLVYQWKPNASRLQLSLFLLWAPVAGMAWQWIRAAFAQPRRTLVLQVALAALLTVGSLRTLFINPSRPLLPRPSDGANLWTTPRAQLLFINAPEFMPGFLPLIDAARGIDCQEIGLVIDSSHPEYPFWALLAPPGSGVHLDHIGLPTPEGGLPPSAEVCAIVCTICSDREYEGMELRFNVAGRHSLYLPPR